MDTFRLRLLHQHVLPIPRVSFNRCCLPRPPLLRNTWQPISLLWSIYLLSKRHGTSLIPLHPQPVYRTCCSNWSLVHTNESPHAPCLQVLLCNQKPRAQVERDLMPFLEDGAGAFTEWLWRYLQVRPPHRKQV